MFSQTIKFLKPIIFCLLFLLAGKSTFATELITNPSFETVGSGWVVLTNGTNQTDSWWNINNSAGANSGNRYVYLGAQIDGVSAANNVNGLLYQTVTIPAGTTSANLTYYVKITSSESTAAAYDTLKVEIQNASGTVLATPNSFSNQNATGSWTQQTVNLGNYINLSSYAGQAIRIAFHGTTDGSTITVFRIDDVSLQASGTTAIAPTVQTLAASLITTTSAQMNGSVNPNGSSTTAYFEYGTTTGYGSTTGSANLGSGTSATPIQAGWSGLSPSTTYHYRAVATNSAGTNRGSDVTFTTSAAAQQTGSLQVSIAPAGAVSAGAQWQVDGGAFQNNGSTVSGLFVGGHTVTFKPVVGWTTPGNHAVMVNANQTTADSVTYVAQPQTGSLQVTLAPVGAVSAGAQWQVDGGVFQSNGATVPNLPVGSHTVAFKSISGWTTPGNQTVSVNANLTTTTSGTYQAVSSSQLVVNGHVLSSNQASWVTYVGTQILPQLPGTLSGKVTVASRVSWWSLKEGIFGLNNPHVFSLCHTSSGDVRYDSQPLNTCNTGQPWQVGLAAIQVPDHTDQSVLDALNVLWPGRAVTDVLSESARLAGFDPTTGTGAAIVASTGYLKRSWLLRHPAIGMYLEEPLVTAQCINSAISWCYGTAWQDSAYFAPTQQAAFQSISELAAIFTTLNTQSGNGAFNLRFPLTLPDGSGYTAYTAPVSSVFDHSMSARYTYDQPYRVVTFNGEIGDQIDLIESKNPLTGLVTPPYSFKKPTGTPANQQSFLVNVINYQGTNLSGSTTINYDGHPGYDYKVGIGTPVYAAADGNVVVANTDPNDPIGKAGMYIRVQHDPAGYQTQYQHLSEVLVSQGANVTRGQLIGKSGNTGPVTTGPHLHFEVKKWNGLSWIAVDPYGMDPAIDPYVANGNPASILLWGDRQSEITSLTATPQHASWVYYQSSSGQWYISASTGETYLLSGANGIGGELVWGKIANANPVATVDYVGKTVYIAPTASAQTSASSYPGVTIAGARNVTVVSSRGYTAAQQLDGQTLPHAWYFFQVQSTGIWYIVNLNGPTTDVYRLRLKPDNSDYDWLLISNSSWTRSFSGTASNMNITLTGR